MVRTQKLGFARDVKNVWLAGKTLVCFSFGFSARVHIDLLAVLLLFPWDVWCVTLAFRKDMVVAIFLAEWARLAVFVHDGILDFDEPVGLVCFYLGRKTYLLPCILYHSFKALSFYCLYCAATCLVCRKRWWACSASFHGAGS